MGRELVGHGPTTTIAPSCRRTPGLWNCEAERRWNGGGLGNGWQKSRARPVVGWVAQATGLSRRATRLPLGVGRPSSRCAGKGRVGRSVVSAEARRQVATEDGPVARSTRIKSADPEDRRCSMPIRICDPQALTADGRAGRAEALPSAIRRDKVSNLALPAPMSAARRRPERKADLVVSSGPQKSLITVVRELKLARTLDSQRLGV